MLLIRCFVGQTVAPIHPPLSFSSETVLSLRRSTGPTARSISDLRRKVAGFHFFLPLFYLGASPEGWVKSGTLQVKRISAGLKATYREFSGDSQRHLLVQFSECPPSICLGCTSPPENERTPARRERAAGHIKQLGLISF